MLKLHGFPISNFYNKVKLALLEKGVEFEEVRSAPGRDEATFAKSPLGKIPWLELDDGRTISESTIILEYVEAVYPEPPMLPRDPYAAAEVRRLMNLVDAYFDAPARPLYGAALRGSEVHPILVERGAIAVRRSAQALARLAKFGPFLAGSEYTYADAAAFATLPGVRETMKIVVKEDILAAGGAEFVKRYDEWEAMMLGRPATKKVERGRKATMRAQAMVQGAGG